MFWKNFVKLCNEKKQSPSAVCIKLGFSNATATNWKKGAQPRDTAINKVADYFNVSAEYLLGRNEDSLDNNFNISSNDTKEKEILRIFRKLNEEKQNKVIGYAEAQLNDNDNVYYIGYNAAMGGERTETIHTKEELVSAHDKLRARLKKKKEEK